MRLRVRHTAINKHSYASIADIPEFPCPNLLGETPDTYANILYDLEYTNYTTCSNILHGSVACGFLRPSAMDKQKSEFKSVEKQKTSQSSVHSNREDNISGGKV